jgi:hypothetical protein
MDTLDNRRANLRVASNSQNGANRKASRSSKSGIKGVCWHRNRQKCVVQIKFNGVVYSLGYYDDPLVGSEVYAAKARELQGEFSRSR